jgi:hypothetical protein
MNGFDSDLEKVWIYKLVTSFNKANQLVYKHLKKQLVEPIFSVSGELSVWGRWCPNSREIKISYRLLKNFEWAAVEHVLNHEIAHMVVDEIFNLSIEGVCHGAAFKKACDVLGIDCSRCVSEVELAGFKSDDSSNGVVDKVRKLMIKGNCESITKEEADLFLKKAQSIMVKHNVNMASVSGSDKFFIVRPVGRVYKNMPSYMTVLRDIVKTYYFVRTISTYMHVHTGTGYRASRRIYIEMFGEKHNVDLAEYVYHSLLYNAELSWKEFSAQSKKEGLRIRGNFSKSAFIRGLFDGYENKLASYQSILNDEQPEALVLMSDPLIDEMFKKQYPHMRNKNCYCAHGGGYKVGYEKGQTMKIARGVAAVGNGGKYLN